MSSALRTQQKRLLKKFRADPRLWIERCLKIIDKQGREVPFKLNSFQNHYYEILKREYWKPYTLPSGRQVFRFQGIREVNLKSRQIGGSAIIDAILLHDTVFFPGTRTWIFCQDEDAGKTMLEEKIKFPYASIHHDDPLIVLPKPDTNNVKVLGFPSIASKISCRSPGQSQGQSRKKGRSITLRNALLSELAEWPYADELIQGITPALNDPTTNIFIESSPKLKGDYFHRFYMMAKAGEGGWKARFWPWFFDDQLREPIYSEDERQELIASLTDDERELGEMAERDHGKIIDLEQYKWRRKTKASPALAAKGPMAFRQEYLENDSDCFESTGSSIFRDDNHNLKTLLTMEREAVPGRMHVIFADIADGTGGDGDYTYITVIDCLTREQIYKLKTNTVDSTKAHWLLYETWLKYPGVVGIETNGIGRATIAMARNEQALVKDENGIERPMCQVWEDFVHCGHPTYDGLPTLGEKSTEIYLLRASLLEAVEYYKELSPGPLDVPGRGIRIGSQDILDHYDHFQNLGGGKMGAVAPLKDDGIMSLLGAHRLLREAGDYQRVFNKRFSQFKQQTEEAAA